MKTLRETAQEYLRMRRGLGFKLRHDERRLKRFVAFMEQQNASHITSELALKWAMQPADAQPATWGGRLTSVRGFARYCSGADPRTEIPPVGLVPYRPRRATPYLYSEQEIRRLMAAARALRPSGGLRGLTYCCLFGLLTVTGLRISEALALTRKDVDLQNGLLTIRGAKFGKSRLVPLHASARRALASYAQQRDAYLNQPPAANFLLCDCGRSPEVSTVRRVFYQLSRQIGLRGLSDRRGPRLQDFRHLCPQKSWCDGTELARMPSVACRSYPPIWATSMSVTRSGTCQGAPSSWNKRLGGWKNAGGRGHETSAQLPRAAGELLHPTPDGSTSGQPTHYRFVSGHLSLATELCAKAAP
jgi:integrase